MNELEEKARFFAQYWGQPVLCFNGICNTLDEYFFLEGRIEDSSRYLLLKSLQDITEEDAMEFFRMFNTEPIYVDEKKFNNAIRIFSEGLILNSDLENHCLEETIQAVDFLRSRGYALPWNGKSVEQLQELNWIKIIER